MKREMLEALKASIEDGDKETREVMPEHTPGPWSEAFEPWDDHPLGARVIRNQDQCLIAAIRYPDREDSKADARLIAAAPVLLKACDAALAKLTGNGMDGTLGWCREHPIVTRLREAIETARGVR